MANWSTKKLEEQEDKSKDIRTVFLILTGRSAHILTVIITGHLLVEYCLDQIIIAKVKDKKAILKKKFSEKLEILYPTWLPLHIYKNIKLLNNARNYAAHNLGVIDNKPIIYTPTREEKTLIISKRNNKGKIYLRELINSILFDLVNDSFYSLGILAEPALNIIFRTKKI